MNILEISPGMLFFPGITLGILFMILPRILAKVFLAICAGIFPRISSGIFPDAPPRYHPETFGTRILRPKRLQRGFYEFI